MRCKVAIEGLLEADLAELEGRGDGELARHLAGCERCTRVAATLVAELGEVDEALAAYGSAGAADAAADRALAAAVEQRPSAPGHRSWSTPGRSWRWLGAPVAAAAVLAMLLLLGRGDEAPPGIAAGSEPERTARVAVTPPPDRGVAVLETQNPKITIIWLYEREES